MYVEFFSFKKNYLYCALIFFYYCFFFIKYSDKFDPFLHIDFLNFTTTFLYTEKFPKQTFVNLNEFCYRIFLQ